MCELSRTMEGSSITDHFQHPHKETTGGAFPVSAFSTFHILRNYNNLLFPHPQDISKPPTINEFYDVPSEKLMQSLKCKDYTFPVDNKAFLRLPHPPGAPTQSILNYPSHLYLNHNDSPAFRHRQLPLSPRDLLSPCSKRQRGEKKPIPEEQKDDKYFERRKRNNQAAKKSRDARKYREDQIALRAALLEHENAILKAQILTLREEATSLRQMLLQKKSLELPS